MTQTPIYLTLKHHWFDEIAANRKTKEYRVRSQRINENTCLPGRTIIFSRGYSKTRIRAEIEHVEQKRINEVPNLSSVYPNLTHKDRVIVITFRNVRLE